MASVVVLRVVLVNISSSFRMDNSMMGIANGIVLDGRQNSIDRSAVPIVTFLFMAAVMFPLFMPQNFTVDKLLRAQVAFVMVIAAYLAEVIRAGLQAVPKGQYEAAASMGLTFWPTTILITLPQALRITIPGLVNTFISIFKDTSLVAVIGLFDLLGTAKAVLVDPKWIGFAVEVYFFVACVYFVFSFAVSQYSQYLERMLTARTLH